MDKSYSELMKLETYEQRLEYLRLSGKVGLDTFGFDRYLNQNLYQRDSKWKAVRRDVILRDRGCDLGIEGIPIGGRIFVHHISPITQDDVISGSDKLYNPDNLISCSKATHDAIHYGTAGNIPRQVTPTVRTEFDTCPWKKGV